MSRFTTSGLSHRDARAALLASTNASSSSSLPSSRSYSPALDSSAAGPSSTSARRSRVASPSPYASDPYAGNGPYGGRYGAASSTTYGGYGYGQAGAAPAQGYGAGAYGQQRSAEDLESQNDERLDGLSAKVKMLKDITVGIGNEVRESTLDMGTMNDAFASTATRLGTTFRNMNRMASRQGGQWCRLMMFLLLCLWIFFFVWWIRR